MQYCARYSLNPGLEHFKVLDNIFAYLIKYPDLGITYNAILTTTDNLLLKGYSDLDWANCIDSRRSTTGYITTLGGNIISWCVSLQKLVAFSSTEAEYMVLSEACKEIIYL